MKVLRDLASAARRISGSNGMASMNPASVVRTSGMSRVASLADRVLGSALDGHDVHGGRDFQDVEDLQAAPAQDPRSHPDAPGQRVTLPAPARNGSHPPSGSGTAPAIYQQNGTPAAIFKGGQQHARWRNVYVSHAMPAVLQLQRQLSAASFNQPIVRAQLSLEVRLFRDRLSKANCEWNQVTDASYLLCTYLDEAVSDAARGHAQIPYEGDRSLLVEFHGDAWGGEDAFADLERWMSHDHPPLDLLALYEMLLALGWQGRYRVLDRGDVLLQDLRSRLHAQVWQNRQPESLGTALLVSGAVRPRWWNLHKVGLCLFAVAGLAYVAATIDLDARGRPVREAIAAWAPPARSINLADTLPPPLPQLIAEGWLTAQKHPLGWLLIFRSDGAFEVGKAVVKPTFSHNIDRLGLAFAPWPGDLEVIGHTDMQPIKGGVFKNNQALSEARAENVAQRLRQLATVGGPDAPANVVKRQISASGRGETEPGDPSDTPAAFERNRRVEVLWKVVPAGRGPAAEQRPGATVP